MKILAVDTASKSCSVAVLDENSVISEFTVNHKDTHSRFLMGTIRHTLDVCRLAITDLDGFAVTIGPGSFTGLRIGLSAVKGLALATGKPVVGVSSLEALAFQVAEADKLICPMLDARRHEVYTACYRFRGPDIEIEQAPRAISPDKAVEDITVPCIMVGDGSVFYQDVIRDALGPLVFFADPTRHLIRACSVGRIAMQKFKTNETDDPAQIKPIYLRKSDAEKNLKKNRKGLI